MDVVESNAIELRKKDEDLSPAAIALEAQALGMVKARVALAIQRPRDVDVFRDRLLKECKRPGFADAAIYAKPVGGKTIEGPSIRFAEAAARLYGNLLVGVEAVSADDKRIHLRAMAMDLESNTTDVQDQLVERTVERKDPSGRSVLSTRRNSKGEPTYLVEATEDDMIAKTNAAASKLRRGRIIAMLPADIVEESIKLCNRTCADRDAKDPVAAFRLLADSFSSVHVSPADLKDYLGHELEKITAKELADLRAIYNGLRQGEGTWAEVVVTKGKSIADVPAVGSKTEQLKAELVKK